MLSDRTLQSITGATLATLALAANVCCQTPPVGESAAVQSPPAASKRSDAPLPATPDSQVPADVAWGSGREVQAGLTLAGRYGRVDQHIGLYMFGILICWWVPETIREEEAAGEEIAV